MVKRWAIKYPSGAYDVMSNLVPKRLCSVIVSFRKKKYPFIKLRLVRVDIKEVKQ